MNSLPFKQALLLTMPVASAYVPLGAAFGVLFSTALDIPWIYAVFMGAFVYSGALQFFAVGLLADHAGLLAIFISAVLLSIRHIFYGISILPRFRQPWLARLFLIFALTDETYSLISSLPDKAASKLMLTISYLNYFYWLLGCAIGAYLGARFTLAIAGLDFILAALFVVLAMEQYRRNRSMPLVIAAAAIGALCTLWVFEYMLIASLSLATVSVLLKGYLWPTAPST